VAFDPKRSSTLKMCCGTSVQSSSVVGFVTNKMNALERAPRVVALAVLLSAAVCDAGMQASAQQPGKPSAQLLESVPWLVKNQGPGAAKGVIYLIHGYDRVKPIVDDYDAVQPFVIGLNRQGWDVIGAKVPQRATGALATDLIGAIAPGLPAKADALRKQGYQRVVFGGQSWGAWLSLVATTKYKMKADGLILVAPATHGTRQNDEGKPNPKYELNKTEFLPMIAGDSAPSIVVFFKNDDFDPGGRGPFTQSTFDKRQVPYILVDGPAGLVGHGASWFPLFDYAFGDCFATFLAAPATRPACRHPWTMRNIALCWRSRRSPTRTAIRASRRPTLSGAGS
jgi:hypothetical protein